MQRFCNICCYFGQNPKRKRSISSSNFDGQLSNILFIYLCLCVKVLRVVRLLLRPNSKVQGECISYCSDETIGRDYFSTYGWRGAWIVYENAKLDSEGMWVLLMVLVGYGSNENRFRAWKKVNWITCYSDCKHLHQRSSSSSLSVIYQFYEPEW